MHSFARLFRAVQVSLIIVAQRGLLFCIFSSGVGNIHALSCLFERDMCEGRTK